ncbi:LLM class F420-dependent oxidoreductase [Virgisporangium ochraceum]|uniref:LLM class F420-dependent oxidoreductase n=1 Tax=Virgisporangium ochraceum TaxID=65505 RepID=A0A8J3ZXL5_9ACTN|nr:TIGR03619 family F420-dependent LLM class oxidoreductase [Virgisporangium ochraceum]GIJ71972.1 LLM class F420-dependent oxidoreductase [Virgisporangium ochraceum]
MDLGIGLPTAGSFASPANIARLAREAEDLGYASVWTFERLLRPLEPVSMYGGPAQPVPEVYSLVYEPLETLSWVAAQTTRVRLGTSVIDALLHPPVVLARRFAALDQFSGGRVVAGLGQGWMPQEFETANVPMKRMGAGIDEVVDAMRACWGPDPVSYSGRFYRIAESELNPKPVQERIPVLLGSMTPAGIERAARIADGLNPIAFSAEQIRETVAAYRSLAPASATVVVRANTTFSVEPLGEKRPYLGGSPEQIAEDLAGLDGAGIDEVLLSTVGRVRHDLVTEIRLMERIRETAVMVNWS